MLVYVLFYISPYKKPSKHLNKQADANKPHIVFASLLLQFVFHMMRIVHIQFSFKVQSALGSMFLGANW